MIFSDKKQTKKLQRVPQGFIN